MIYSVSRTIFNFSKLYFNRLDQVLAGWEYRLTYQELVFRPTTSRSRLPALPTAPTDKIGDQLLAYDQAAFSQKRLRVKPRFWSLGLRRHLISLSRRGLFRIRLIGSRLYFKLIER